ncbi:MAG: DcaP family trimeric outer membrane transporter [Gemmatimonadota bacterium]
MSTINRLAGRRHARGGRAAMCLILLVSGAAWSAPRLAAQNESHPELAWYGYVKLDAAWDEGPVSAGNFARWVFSADIFKPHSHFNMTARQTRLGFRARTRIGTASVTGRWEADFYGGGAENKNSLQVRHAYVEIAWPSGWSILAGQGSDVISPLNPSALNYTVAWWAGNIGYRRPQFRVTRTFTLASGGTLTFQGAAARTIGDDFIAAEPGDAGADAGRPTFQGLAGSPGP